MEDLNGEVLVRLRGRCTYVNACTRLHGEGVYDVFGFTPCGRLLAFAGIAEVALGKTFDAKLTKYNPPNCEGKILEA